MAVFILQEKKGGPVSVSHSQDAPLHLFPSLTPLWRLFFSLPFPSGINAGGHTTGGAGSLVRIMHGRQDRRPVIPGRRRAWRPRRPKQKISFFPKQEKKGNPKKRQRACRRHGNVASCPFPAHVLFPTVFSFLLFWCPPKQNGFWRRPQRSVPFFFALDWKRGTRLAIG